MNEVMTEPEAAGLAVQRQDATASTARGSYRVRSGWQDSLPSVGPRCLPRSQHRCYQSPSTSPHVLDLLLLDIGCGGRIGAVIDMKGKKVSLDLGIIDLLGEGFVDTKRRKLTHIVPITGPMQRILVRLMAKHGDGYLIHAGDDPLSEGARNWTQIIQRLVARASKSRTPDQVKRKLLEPTPEGNLNWYSIRRTFADWLDERVSDAAISAVMGRFEISNRTRRRLFEKRSPITDLYKRRKLGPVLGVADVLEREWWPSIQPYTSVDLRSDEASLMRADAAK